MANAPIAGESVTIDPSTWTSIYAPRDCATVTLHQTDLVYAAKYRLPTSAGGTSAEKTIPAGAERTLGGTPWPTPWRWRRNDLVCEVQAVTGGTGPIHVEFS